MELNTEKNITLDEYQEQAMTTCMPTCDNISYMVLNMMGEVGELASKIAKAIRKGQAKIENNKLVWIERPTAEGEYRLQAEAGDCLWQLSGICHVMGWRLSDVGRENLAKLKSRQERDVIDGSGDTR